MNRPIGGLYVSVSPADGRIRLVCARCGIDRVALTYAEAKRDAETHRQQHTPQKRQQW